MEGYNGMEEKLNGGLLKGKKKLSSSALKQQQQQQHMGKKRRGMVVMGAVVMCLLYVSMLVLFKGGSQLSSQEGREDITLWNAETKIEKKSGGGGTYGDGILLDLLVGEQMEETGRSSHKPHDRTQLIDTDANVPGTVDLYGELEKYWEELVSKQSESLDPLIDAQEHTKTKDIGMDHLVHGGASDARIEFINRLYDIMKPVREKHGKVCITAAAAQGKEDIEKDVLPWIQYHTEMGIDRFYILYDGSDEPAVDILSSIHHVDLIHIHEPFATKKEVDLFKKFSAGEKKNAVGNFELMKKQKYCVTEAIARARRDSQDWIMHIDPDELFLVGGSEANIPGYFAKLGPHVPAMRFMNFEGQAEAGDVESQFLQITLFRAPKFFITPEANHYRSTFKQGLAPSYIYLYANGKSAARVNADGLSVHGPHYFKGNSHPSYNTTSNPGAKWKNYMSNEAIILHYTYSYMSDVRKKSRRSCPKDYDLTTKTFQEIKKDCFILSTDADAFQAAEQGEEEVARFYYSRFVLSEGAPVSCMNKQNTKGWCPLTDIPKLRVLLERVGLLKRVLMPQQILWSHEMRIRELAAKHHV